MAWLQSTMAGVAQGIAEAALSSSQFSAMATAPGAHEQPIQQHGFLLGGNAGESSFGLGACDGGGGICGTGGGVVGGAGDMDVFGLDPLWGWEAAVQTLTDSQCRSWLSLASCVSVAATFAASSSLLLPPAAADPRAASAAGKEATAASAAAEARDEDDDVTADAIAAAARRRASAAAARRATGLRRRGVKLLSSNAERLLAGVVSSWVRDVQPLLLTAVMLVIFVTPGSACVAAVVSLPWTTTQLALACWMVAEAVFFALRYAEYRRADLQLMHPPLPTPAEGSRLLDRIFSLKGWVLDPHEFLSGWFLGSPVSSISRNDVREFISFGFYHRCFSDLPPEHQTAVEGHVLRVEEEFEMRFLESSGPAESNACKGDGQKQRKERQQHLKEVQESAVRFMAHTREPLRAVLHPLAFYVWGHAVGWLTAAALSGMGFTRRVCKNTGLAYFCLRRSQDVGSKAEGLQKPPKVWQQMKAWQCEKQLLQQQDTLWPKGQEEEEGGQQQEKGAGSSRVSSARDGDDSGDACVFVHGLGVGVTPYLAFIGQLLQMSKHKVVIVVELPHLAFRLSSLHDSKVPTVTELAEGLDEVLEREGIAAASFVGHSYGSFVLAQYARTRPHHVQSMGLIDPVCVLLCLPHVLYNFVYKFPGSSSVGATVAEALRWLLCSRELSVARALCRGFNWHDLHIWADEMPKRTVVMLAGDDQIVPSVHVRRYLEAHGVPVLFNHKMHHAQFLFRPDVQKSFLRTMFG